MRATGGVGRSIKASPILICSRLFEAVGINTNLSVVIVL